MSALATVKKFFPQVREVVDALRAARVEVTAQDASSKGIKNHEACAMAVACKRKFNLDGVIISRSTAYLIKGRKARRFHLPPGTAREVVSFDRGAGFAKGTYLLSAIPEQSRLGKRTGTNTKNGTTGAPKRFRHLTANVRTVLGGEQPKD